MNNLFGGDNLIRIYFRLDPGEWHGHPNEGLWAEPIGNGNSSSVFRLRNSPFFTRDVSFEDVVRAVPRTDAGKGLEYAGVIDRSGHSTYMLLVPPDRQDYFVIYWKRLEFLGCTFESTSIKINLGYRTLYSVDIPNTTDIYAVWSILDEGEKRSAWIFQEGHVGHKLNTSKNNQT